MVRMEALRAGVCLLGFATLSQAAPVSNTHAGKMSSTASDIIMCVCLCFTHVVKVVWGDQCIFTWDFKVGLFNLLDSTDPQI